MRNVVVGESPHRAAYYGIRAGEEAGSAHDCARLSTSDELWKLPRPLLDENVLPCNANRPFCL